MGYFNIYGQYINGNDELYHHGILGMKWGNKNGPPYPLKPGDHSAAEKRLKNQNNGPIESWRSKESHRIDKKYKRLHNRASRAAAAARRSRDEAQRNENESLSRSYERKISELVEQSELIEAKRALEKRAIMEMSLNDIKKERFKIGEAKTKARIEILERELSKRGENDVDTLYKEYTKKEKALEDFMNKELAKYKPKNYDERERALAKIEVKNSDKISKMRNDIKDAYDAYSGVRKLNGKDKSRDFNAQVELDYLAKVSGTPRQEWNEAIDRYVNFQKAINDKSANWYEGEPKSERAKKLYSEYSKQKQNLEDTIGKRYHEMHVKIAKQYDDANTAEEKRHPHASREEILEFDEKLRKKTWANPEFVALRNKYYREGKKIDGVFEKKLVAVVLKDLGLPNTEANRNKIIQSGVLFWD